MKDKLGEFLNSYDQYLDRTISYDEIKSNCIKMTEKLSNKNICPSRFNGDGIRCTHPKDHQDFHQCGGIVWIDKKEPLDNSGFIAGMYDHVNMNNVYASGVREGVRIAQEYTKIIKVEDPDYRWQEISIIDWSEVNDQLERLEPLEMSLFHDRLSKD